MRLQSLGMNLLMRHAPDAPGLFFGTRGDSVAGEAAIALSAAEGLRPEGSLEMARRDLERALRALLAARGTGWMDGHCRDVEAGLDRAARRIVAPLGAVLTDGARVDRVALRTAGNEAGPGSM